MEIRISSVMIVCMIYALTSKSAVTLEGIDMTSNPYSLGSYLQASFFRAFETLGDAMIQSLPI